MQQEKKNEKLEWTREREAHALNEQIKKIAMEKVTKAYIQI